ncbi:hypothetical protein BT96DRAFT_976603 [Gymnopus androsaceus JB14]|uniref:Uncharacterized protein n=1 Tax=Gymnopus androsaceus JB14 TaxID=1447944 RepID=A0A6A4HJK0_9AGAR|nr:hypothetical protein BT96DRAFT_976603 [Gymnopus androsaceus JB14]
MPSLTTFSRHSVYSTPSRVQSPPASMSSHSTPTITPSAKHNLVTRVAIEGKAKQNEDSVSIKMYLKMSIPLDSASPVHLFPEENVKILSSQVHPLDSNSVPYNFDSTVSPLLHRAARALKLPERSTEDATSVDTGHILVSGYHISYVLPTRRTSKHGQFMAVIDLLIPYLAHPPRSPYILSIPTPRCLHNSISLRIFPPSISSSFASLSDSGSNAAWDLTSDPHVTRATSTKANSNFADDESSASDESSLYGYGIHGSFPSAERIRVRWAKPIINSFSTDDHDQRRRVGVKDVKGEMTCVVRGVRESDANAGVLMDISYKGTCKGVWFPGVATLLGMDLGLVAKNADVEWPAPADGDAGGEWQVSGGTGYTGFDVGTNQLFRTDSIDSSSGQQPIPIANGDLLRFRPPTSTNSSTSSLLRAPLPTAVADYSFEGSPAGAGLSSSSSSLSSLHASVSNLTSLSQSRIETSSNPDHPITLHLNMNELLPAPASNSRSNSNMFVFSVEGRVVVFPRGGHRDSDDPDPSPGDNGYKYITLTLPRFTVHAADSESMSVVVKNDLPEGDLDAGVEVYKDSSSSEGRTMLQKGAMTKCSSSDNGIRVRIPLKKPGHFPFPSPSSGVGINGTPKAKQLNPSVSLWPATPNGSASSTPLPNTRIPRTSSSLRKRHTRPRPRRDGPSMIPWASAVVTPLVRTATSPSSSSGYDYAVRLCLPAPAADSNEGEAEQCLEFGLAKPGSEGKAKAKGPPKVDLVSVSVDGVPVRFESTAAALDTNANAHANATTLDATLDLGGLGVGGVQFGETSGKEWISWIRVFTGGAGAGGGMVVVDYVVREEEREGEAEEKENGKGKKKKKGKAKDEDEVLMNVYLPSFALPVGRLEVVVEDTPGLDLSSLRTNLLHSTSPPTTQQQQQRGLGGGVRLLHYSTEEFFYPHLEFRVRSTNTSSFSSNSNYSNSKSLTLLTLLILLILSITLLYTTQIRWRVHQMGKSLEQYSLGSRWGDVNPEPNLETITVTTTMTTTTTVYSSTTPRWWLNRESESLSADSSMPTPTSTSNAITAATTSTTAKPKPKATTSSSSTPKPKPLPSSSSASSSPSPSNALIPIQSIWNWTNHLNYQWSDLKPLAQSTVKVLKKALGPAWKVITVIWWGPD